jgi:hypothetical protein
MVSEIENKNENTIKYLLKIIKNLFIFILMYYAKLFQKNQYLNHNLVYL